MKKHSLIGVSILAMVLLVLGSFNNIVSYQTVQASNQTIINSEINQKEMLFQAIVDMVNNREIQKVIIGSEITGKGFFNYKMGFSVFTSPTLIKRQLNFLLFLGMSLSKIMRISKSSSLVGERQIATPNILQRITNIIKTDAKLNKEITQLSDLSCHCNGENSKSGQQIICAFLFLLLFTGAIFPNLALIMIAVVIILAGLFKCPWAQIPDNP